MAVAYLRAETLYAVEDITYTINTTTGQVTPAGNTVTGIVGTIGSNFVTGLTASADGSTYVPLPLTGETRRRSTGAASRPGCSRSSGPSRIRSSSDISMSKAGELYGTSLNTSSLDQIGPIDDTAAFDGAFAEIDVNSGLPNTAFGFFLVGEDRGFVANPGGSAGNICLGGGIGRYVGPGQIQNTGQTGSFSLVLDLGMTPRPTGFVSA